MILGGFILTNYLKATDKEVGLLLNFGNKPEFKRIVLGNETKNRFTQTTSVGPDKNPNQQLWPPQGVCHEGITADFKRIQALVQERTTPANRPEAEIGGVMC